MSRYLVGEFFFRGHRDACWTSEKPGVTGPPHYEQIHRGQTRWRLVAVTLGWLRSILGCRRGRGTWVYYWRRTAR